MAGDWPEFACGACSSVVAWQSLFTRTSCALPSCRLHLRCAWAWILRAPGWGLTVRVQDIEALEAQMAGAGDRVRNLKQSGAPKVRTWCRRALLPPTVSL